MNSKRYSYHSENSEGVGNEVPGTKDKHQIYIIIISQPLSDFLLLPGVVK